jgi:hypothetical protein
MKIEIHDPGSDDTVEAESTSIDAAIRDYLRGIEDCFGSGPFDILAREVGEPRFRVYRCNVEVVTRYDITVRATEERRSLAQDDDR